MTPEDFEARHGPDYNAWLEDHPMPPETFNDRQS